MSLPLSPDAGGNQHPAVGLDAHASPLVRPDAGPLDVGNDPEPDVFPLGTKARLFFLYKTIVANELDRLFQRRLIVSRVIDQRLEVLEDDFVVVGEIAGADEVSAPDLDAIDAHFARRDVEQALDDEHPVLTPRAAHRCDDGLVGEDGGELGKI